MPPASVAVEPGAGVSLRGTASRVAPCSRILPPIGERFVFFDDAPAMEPPPRPRNRTAPQLQADLPPHDDATERAVLGSLIMAPSELATVRRRLSTEAFFDLRNRATWLALCRLTDRRLPIEVGALAVQLRDDGHPDPFVFTSSLLDATPSAASLPFYVERLCDIWQRRNAYSTGVELADAATNPTRKIEIELAAAAEACRWQVGTANADMALSLTSLPDPREADPAELIRDRFLCRGATLLLVGRTGLGKSSLALQLAISWAIGRECFGFRPAAPLRSLFIQSENDPRDLSEMRSGIFDGLELCERDWSAAGEAVNVCTIDDSTGIDFVRHRLAPLVERVKPDLLWLDPLLGYLGGDVCDQRTVSDFLRVHLAPIIHRARLGFVPIHHTPKPPKEDSNGWGTTDFAYSGAGSAELANFPRAVVCLEPTKTHGLFKLRLGKRGRRVGWLEADGETPAYERLVAHGRRGIYWRTPDPDEELTADTGAFNRGTLMELVPLEKPIAKDALISLAKTRKHIGEKRAKGFLAELLDAEEVFEWRVARHGTNPKRFIARQPQEEGVK